MIASDPRTLPVRGETMFHSVAVIGAPSNIGIRPYDDGRMRHLDRVPDILRERDLIKRLGAMDLGNVTPPPYADFVRPPNRARNEEQVVAYSRALSERVAEAVDLGRFAVVVGGDCSNVLGSLLGVRRSVKGPIGLAYVDAHADFATPEESRTGSVASMALALAVGRGNSPLARLAGRSPLVEGRHVALIGRRDAAQAWYGHAALAGSRILDIPDSDLEDRAFGDTAATVLNPAVMPAVDSPEPGGLLVDELATLLAPLVRHPLAMGLSLSIYDPAFDPDRSGARLLVSLLESLLRE